MKRIGIVLMVTTMGLVTSSAAQSASAPGSAVTSQTGVVVPAGTESPHLQGEVIIKLKGSLSPTDRVAALTALGLTSLQRFDEINADLVSTPVGETVAQAVARLTKEPTVEYVEPNFQVRTQ